MQIGSARVLVRIGYTIAITGESDALSLLDAMEAVSCGLVEATNR